MLPAGTIIDEKYEMVSTLGAGGFGAVYAAVQKQFDRKVAIKMLNTTLLQEPGGRARFEREAKAINTLKHKNIVGIYGYGTWRQAPYMVMELIKGRSLDNILADGRIEPPRAMRLIKQVLEALGCAHATGVVHRDLKPSNVMVSIDAEGVETVKIIDFGLVKLMPGYGIPGQKLTDTGYALGTCHYMAPEQAIGGSVDGRADIYAAGCIFYQMLTGALPFDAQDNVAIMYAH
jgi:serine/threonine protein kinase